VHLVGFIIRIYHDARSSECQKFVTAFTRTRYLSLSWANSIQSMLPSYFLTFCLNIILPSTPVSSKLSLSLRVSYPKPVYTFPLPHTCYMPPAYHSSRFDHPKKFWWGVHNIKILIMQFSPPPVTSSVLGPNILFSTLFSDTLSLRLSPNASDQISHSCKTTSKIIILYILILIFFG